MTYIKTIFLLFISLCCFLSTAHARSWQVLKPGLEYTEIDLPDSNAGAIHAFRIDLTRYTLSSVFASDYQKIGAKARELMELSHGIMAINGGFFSPTLDPMGLRISNYQQKSPLRKISWWHVFYVKNNHPYIVSSSEFHQDANIQFAIQAGPRLLNHGRISEKLKAGEDERTALAIDPENRVLLLVTEQMVMSTEELAKLLKKSEPEGGFGCIEALNLDGGNSSQLFSALTEAPLDIFTLNKVADAVVLLPKS